MKLVPAQILFISLVLLTMAIIGGWGYIEFSVYGNEEAVLTQELKAINLKFDEMTTVNKSYDEVRSQYEAAVSNFDSLKHVVATRDNYVDILQLIKVLAEENKVEIKGIAPNMEDSFPAIKDILETTEKHIERYPIHCRVKGDFLSIGHFLESLESIPSVINTGKIEMNTLTEKDGFISCDVVLFSYIYFDKVKG